MRLSSSCIDRLGFILYKHKQKGQRRQKTLSLRKLPRETVDCRRHQTTVHRVNFPQIPHLCQSPAGAAASQIPVAAQTCFWTHPPICTLSPISRGTAAEPDSSSRGTQGKAVVSGSGFYFVKVTTSYKFPFSDARFSSFCRLSVCLLGCSLELYIVKYPKMWSTVSSST